MHAAAITHSRLTFERFDETYLEKSWHWLHDPEIKRLTMSPDFTKEDQLRWFARLPEMTDYQIWGVACDGVPIGVVGLKHVNQTEAEYWGYLGDRDYWNAGLGRKMMRFALSQAREQGLSELYLNVYKQNPRAIHLYTRFGFKATGENGEALHMRRPLNEVTESGTPAFSVVRYTPDRKEAWNTFVNVAKNATFVFHRDYMDYHQDRFTDYSLMVFEGRKLVALLPANLAADGTVHSHEGLSYGGLVVARPAPLHEVLSCFHACLRYLHERQISLLRFKRLPGFYNTLPDDEVAYALFLLEARLYRRDCAAVVSQDDRLSFQERRRRQIKKAGRFNVRIVPETNFSAYWERVLVPRLAARHGVKPVHTIEEITLLASRFPENIRQFSVYWNHEIVAGTTIFEMPTVAHAQYIAVTEPGQNLGALDYLFQWLIDERYRGKRYFDFGICNEHDGRVLNHGLMAWKEGFGARSFAHDFYEIATANYGKLESVIPATLADC